MKATAHRWRVSARAAGERRGLFFGCPCGFSVLQLSAGNSHPEAFVRAVNEHLRQIAVDNDARKGAHLKLATRNFDAQ